MSLHDPQTGLPGQTLLLDRLAVAVTRATRTGTTVGLLLVDPAHDTATAASWLEDVIRAGDTIAHVDGELAVLVDDLASSLEAGAVAERALTRLGGPPAAIGVVVVEPARWREAEDALEDARAALTRARRRGGGWAPSDDAAQDRAAEHARTDAELRQAIASGQLRLHYQPIVAIDDGLAQGVEALVRWEHPEHGLLGPDEFVDVAESTGAIVALGEWVLGEACRRMAAWRATLDVERVWLAVNVSVGQLSNPGIDAAVARALAESGLAPDALHLEVAQGALEGHPAAIDALRRLAGTGVQITLDDVGAWPPPELEELPVTVAKCGPATIETALAAPVEGVEIVAQRMEEREREAVIRAGGCRLGQGFLYARPSAPEDLEALLAAGDRALLES